MFYFPKFGFVDFQCWVDGTVFERRVSGSTLKKRALSMNFEGKVNKMKFLLWLLGGSLTALIVAWVLAAISVSGVQSLSTATVFLWIAFGIFAFCVLVAGIRVTDRLHGRKAAACTLALVGLFFAGLWGRAAIAVWLIHQKATQSAVQQLAPPPSPKPPQGQIPPSTKPHAPASPADPFGSAHFAVRQGGKGNTANPGTNTAPVHIEPCGVFQNGGSNNTASPNCGPPPLNLTYRVLPTDEAKHFADTPGFMKTEIEIVPDQQVSPPFQVSLDFDNPVNSIGNMVLGLNVQMSGGLYRVGRHATTTVLMGIGPLNPLLVVVSSFFPVSIISTPQIVH